jgi:acyl carrier protein
MMSTDAIAPETPRRHAPSRADVVGRLRDLYAEALEYPPDVLTEAALLEADLGVDSLKQTALLSRVFETFGFPDGAEGMRGLDFPSLGRIADHILAQTAPQ